MEYREIELLDLRGMGRKKIHMVPRKIIAPQDRPSQQPLIHPLRERRLEAPHHGTSKILNRDKTSSQEGKAKSPEVGLFATVFCDDQEEGTRHQGLVDPEENDKV